MNEMSQTAQTYEGIRDNIIEDQVIDLLPRDL